MAVAQSTINFVTHKPRTFDAKDPHSVIYSKFIISTRIFNVLTTQRVGSERLVTCPGKTREADDWKKEVLTQAITNAQLLEV
jgi:hypothetical protein